MRRAYGWALAALMIAMAGEAFAVGEVITDVRVTGNVRTQEDTIRSLAGVWIGDTLEVDTLERVRERLNTAGLFAEVNVFWEPNRDGVRVNVVVREKFPWAPVPTFSYSSGNISGGIAVAHGNLFGAGKRGLIGGRISTADSGALVAYQDPAVAGSWLYFDVRGRFQDQIIPEFANVQNFEELPTLPLRETKFRSYGGDVRVGVAWFRKVKTSVGYAFDRFDLIWSRPNANNPYAPADLPAAGPSARRGSALFNLTFDFRSREHAVMYGNALAFGYERARPFYGSDEFVNYWKASTSYEHGLRFFRKHNLILRVGGIVGERVPIWAENYVGGTNLRGFVHRQFAGDTQAGGSIEYQFPMFSVGKLDFRGLVFNDTAAIWYRRLPPDIGGMYEQRSDGRSYLPPDFLKQGFNPDRDVHTGAGAGLRFYLRTVAVPLVGADYAYGFRGGGWRLVLVVGA